MTNPYFYLTEGSRIFVSSLRNRLKPQQYPGNAEEICKKIVKDCWNGTYFQTSTRNFPQFWTRDFGWCVQSLLKLGYKEEVFKTIRYALNRFLQHRKITTAISPGGKPFDFPVPAVDSLPWFIHSIVLSKAPYYEHRAFLNKQIDHFFETFIDSKTGLVKPYLHTSSIKDFAVRRSSCYDNTMVAMLAKDIQSLKLANPFKKYDYPKLLKKHFWNGEYFFDDLKKKTYVAADANLFPFVCGIITDEKMFRSAVEKIQKANLDMPFPLKYTASRNGITFIPSELVMHNYEGTSLWTHMGPLFIKAVKAIDKEKAEEYKNQYRKIIEQHQNYLEVFTPEGKPFSSMFYYCDSGMLWAANYLML